MIKQFPTLATLCATLLTPMLLQAPLAQAATVAAPAEAVGRVIVKYKTEAPIVRRQALAASATPVERAGQMDTLGRRSGLTLRAGHDVGERSHVVFASGVTSEQLAQRLAADADVEYAVPDQRRRAMAAPNDLYYPALPGSAVPNGQWYLRPANGTTKSGINAQQAWDITTGSSSIVVAVLDSGIRFDHEDLLPVGVGSGNVLPGYDMVSDVATANDGTGRDADASDPGDWITAGEAFRFPFEPCGEQDSSWHGTETAALIGAQTNNLKGIAGVGRNVRILPVRVLGKCGGFDSDIIPAMRWAAGFSVAGVPANNFPAQVINLSLGGVGACSAAYRDAVNSIIANGTVIVSSAGNGTGHAVNSPANCPGVIAVSGLRHTGTKVGFSDIGPETTISAPGGNCINLQGQCLYPIVTASNTGATGPVASYYNPEAVGTSFSAPLVAGTVGLMLSVDPTLTPLQVKLILQGTARPFPALTGAQPECTAPQYNAAGATVDQDECECTSGTCGAGMLDAYAAVDEVRLGGIGRGVQARIDLDSRAARAGQPLSLSGINSIAQATVGVKSYRWDIIDFGTGDVVTAFNETGATSASGPTVTITPRKTGQFVVALTVTDNANVSSTSTELAIVAREPVQQESGGGALGAGWLALLGAAVLALRRSPRRT
jgi:serine protease